MASATLSYSQSLRVIGQALDVLRIDSFTLEKTGEEYIVRNWEPSFLKGITETVWGSGESDKVLLNPRGPTEPLVYASCDNDRLEVLGRSRRGLDSGKEPHNVCLGLRVVGDYLDRHRALAFAISWARQSATVKYQTPADGHRESGFMVQNLRDLGTGVYLRRSSRRPSK